MSVIPDAAQRARACDPHTSFIVQAPAGSGKTELLTQRFLVLLAQAVQTPESILAITFTRKAAAEMHARIVKALQTAATEPEPETPHAKHTWHLARAVLQRDAEAGWRLLENPNRLRIQTIDALCAHLVTQMPILSRLGAMPTISDNPNMLYRIAAERTLAGLDQQASWAEPLAHILLHLDNHAERLTELLIAMLTEREQWLPLLSIATDPHALRQRLESQLEKEIQDAITAVHTHIPPNFIEPLLSLGRYAAAHLQKSDCHSPITHCAELTTWPEPTLPHFPIYRGFATLLLTQTHQWRKTVTQEQGFPAPSQSKDKTEKARLKTAKDQCLDFLARCESVHHFHNALVKIATVPPPHYTDTQWTTVRALFDLLTISVAQLQVLFAERGTIDYSEMAQAAYLSLGNPESPTDLALSLDHQIQHLLIDEFQDTSAIQFRFIEQLIAGWTPGDGKTLFLVGDPMQSIYRFRKADVGLFLQAREQGIGSCRLESLTLQTNFRSTCAIIEWINHLFARIFPEENDRHAGAIRYNASLAIQTSAPSPAVHWHLYAAAAEKAEALRITEIIQQTLIEQPDAHIAILVRARPHLEAILPALNTAQIRYRAVDIAPFANTRVIQDLLALTQALLHLGDRIAWLAILRAPWCGLTLNDLHLLANAPTLTLWDALQHHREQLSEEGQKRITRVMPIFSQGLQNCHQIPLQDCIETTWLQLGGPACLSDAAELDHAQLFFKQLTVAAQNIPFDMANFHVQLNACYANTPTDPSIRVDIMSIHKSKGLEFDVVLLPGLGRKPKHESSKLVLSLERTHTQGHTDILLAPIKATEDERDPIYQYLQQIHQQKAVHETTRLLYVAATRAKHTLHLLGHCNESGLPATGSLLAQLWPALDESIPLIPVPSCPALSHAVHTSLHRLPLDWQHPPENIPHVDRID